MEKITIFFIAAIIVESIPSSSSMNISSECSDCDDDTPPSTPKVYSNETNESLKPNEDLCYESTCSPGYVYPTFGINMIKLNSPSTINYIEISLWNEFRVDSLQCFSYYINVSMDRVHWTRVVDHSNYNCRSVQYLWIPPCLARYIHIVGTNSTAGATFKIWSIGYYTERVNSRVKVKNGLVVPSYNVASIYLSTLVIGGANSVFDHSLLDTYYKENKRHDRYTYHVLKSAKTSANSGSIVVHLTQPYILSSIRLLLWGSEEQAYSYTIESSDNGEEWVMVVDKSNELAQSWQVLKFKAMPMLYIRITGVFSSTDQYFRCIYLEAPAQVELDTNISEEDDRAETSAQNPIV